MQLGGNLRRGCYLAAALTAFVVLTATPAPAQQTPTTTAPGTTSSSTPGSAPSQQIVGRLLSGSTPVPGVTITAEAVAVPGNDDFSGQATSDDEGNWTIPVPAPGVY